MDKNSVLDGIFSNDPLNILNVKAVPSPTLSEDSRLVASFEEINAFYEQYNREPLPDSGNIQERTLLARLTSMRSNTAKRDSLLLYDKYNLLNVVPTEINSFDDIFSGDSLGLLNDDSEGLFDYKHISKTDERASANLIARRTPCKNFAAYESIFKEVQNDLSSGKRKLIEFKEENLHKGDFYVHNGILLLLENTSFDNEIKQHKNGPRILKDGRTRIVFENGTESNMLYRSLYKALLINGRAVSKNADEDNESFQKTFSNITTEDKEDGLIYILSSKSDKPEIKSIQNLYKIGFSRTSVEERVKNATQDPTYLMANVKIVMAYKCFNMNPQKLEKILHSFFGNSCLNISVHDKNGKHHAPREWFIAPLAVIEQTVKLIVSGDIINYRYDNLNEVCVKIK
jgi:hypothetical protein